MDYLKQFGYINSYTLKMKKLKITQLKLILTHSLQKMHRRKLGYFQSFSVRMHILGTVTYITLT